MQSDLEIKVQELEREIIELKNENKQIIKLQNDLQKMKKALNLIISELIL